PTCRDVTPKVLAYLRLDVGAPYKMTMSEGVMPQSGLPAAVPRRREAVSVYVVGFWKRLAAAAIDFGVVIPAALIVTWLVSKIAGVHLPPSNLHLFDIDLWIDLVLASDPALMMGMVLFVAIGLTYLLVFHIVRGRTLGMQVLKMKVIDV